MELEVSPRDELPGTFLALNSMGMFLVLLDSFFSGQEAYLFKNKQTLITTSAFLHCSLEVGHFYFDVHCSGAEMLLNKMQLCYAF